ncbi:hypothetical protein [Neolewinella antarctica]|uniref:Outer membrane protein beta-barrel domain-containing protein n=1 Tax=Neolewinella antarctica TaxID=442734 RepID=A0ABX0XER2_9BACT|nr:hypothetical protein [Neolewinella antarctica]NJC27381.1 hypothetical protein [Neolewinella antarctica]
MKYCLLFLLVLSSVASTLSAQYTGFSLGLEAGKNAAEVSHEFAYGIRLDYRVPINPAYTWVISAGVERTNMDWEIAAPRPEMPSRIYVSDYSTLPVLVTGQDDRLTFATGVERKIGDLRLGLQLRGARRLGNGSAIVVSIPTQPYERLPGPYKTFDAKFDEAIVYDARVADDADYAVTSGKFRLQTVITTYFDITSKLSIGLRYGFDAFIKSEAKVLYFDCFCSFPDSPNITFQGQPAGVAYRSSTREHQLMGSINYAF